MYKIQKRNIIKSERFDIIEDTISKDGKLAPYSYVTIGTGISIIPFIDDQHVLVLKEYRHPITSWQYEFPSGGIDKGEKPVDAAKRELLEETGYGTQNIQYLGFTYPSFGSTNEKIHLFASKVKKVSAPHREILEEINPEIITIENLEEMIKNNQFAHGAGEVAWLKWKLKNN